jgi:hypothetical protein
MYDDIWPCGEILVNRFMFVLFLAGIDICGATYLLQNKGQNGNVFHFLKNKKEQSSMLHRDE